MGADPTDQSAATGNLGGADQLGKGYGYDVAWMLPLGPAAFVDIGIEPPPAPPTSNHNVSANQVIGTSGPTGGLEPPGRVVFYFSGEAGESVVSNVGASIIFVSSGASATTADGATSIAIGTLDLGQNIGMIIGGGETKPAPSSFAGVVAFTGSSGTLLLDHSSGFTGTVAGMSGQDTIDFSDINFATPQAPSYSGTSSGGTLTVSDGSHTANIALIGNYLASTFVASSDGHGGTSVMQVPNQPPANDSITHPKT
jgi:hypothetical protein